jgi:phosphoribosylformylglycinamidine cyclo-ligase
MPGLYSGEDYDLAGFAVGEVAKDALIDGTKMEEGDEVIGVMASGFHSNGYSLLRQLFANEIKEYEAGNSALWGMELLKPTKIYVKAIMELLSAASASAHNATNATNIFNDTNTSKIPREAVKGMAHVTGGGFNNIRRINSQFDYILDQYPARDFFPEIFAEVEKRSNLGAEELFSTFNMGIGFVLVVNPQYSESILSSLKASGETGVVIGHVAKGQGDIVVQRQLDKSSRIRLIDHGSKSRP